ncbi:MAG: DNA polymerase III subunit delta [Bacillota bacterium]|uniref:DNA polymerase III subunit delta n=1 Tax=Thermanaerosceptrum fracticalcis TaxID=1712410 RepID=A0A7G6E273_THEFR|nr:DNA polymerase III subunit delta [Thermanaerosceptrum fracticalcis]QNB46177.1 DNA polymerase III subunit delta [Thermanaerosceptrum fracticalcis]
MLFQSVINSIKRGMVSPVYLLHGEEEYLQELIIKALKEHLLTPETGDFNYDELDGENVSPGQIVASANTLPVFAEKRLVIVKRPSPYFLSKKKEGEDTGVDDKCLIEYISEPLSSTCLVFWLKETADKRKKLYKTIEKKGQVVEVTPLKGTELSNWLQEQAGALGKVLEPNALEYIVFHASHDLRSLKNELDKLALFAGEERTISLPVVEKLLTKSIEANIFDLVDSLGLRKTEEALHELRNLLVMGEPAIRILFMIARQFRLILMVKDLEQRGFSEKQITAELSLHPYVTGKILRQARNFTFPELERNLEIILETDFALKNGSPVQAALENLILKLATSS